jgi:hypothetical protein
MRRVAIALGLVALLAAGLAWGVPFLTGERDYVAVTPQPDPLFTVSLIPLRGGQVACMDDAVLDPRSEEARFKVGTYFRPPVPLELTIAGDSYTEHRTISEYEDSEVIRVPIDPPEEETAVSVCIRNLGDRRIALYAAADRTNSRSTVFVDGTPAPADFGIVFYEREPVSVLDRLPTSVERATVFRGPVTTDILWILLALMVVGVPAGILLAFGLSLRNEPPPPDGNGAE